MLQRVTAMGNCVYIVHYVYLLTDVRREPVFLHTYRLQEVKTTSFEFLTVNSVSRTKNISYSITRYKIIDSRLNGIRIFHFFL